MEKITNVEIEMLKSIGFIQDVCNTVDERGFILEPYKTSDPEYVVNAVKEGHNVDKFIFDKDEDVTIGSFTAKHKYCIELFIIDNVELCISIGIDNVVTRYNAFDISDITTPFDEFISDMISNTYEKMNLKQLANACESVFKLNYRPDIDIIDITDEAYGNILNNGYVLCEEDKFITLSINPESFNKDVNFYDMISEVFKEIFPEETYINESEFGVVINTNDRVVVFEYCNDYIRLRSTKVEDITKFCDIITIFKNKDIIDDYNRLD